MSEKRERDERPERTERVPLGTHRMKLQVEQREGYVRRWVNDEPGRLELFLKAGYTFVEDPTVKVGESDAASTPGMGSAVSRHVGTRVDNSPLRAYLMEIPREWYDEDRATAEAEVAAREAGYMRGEDEQGRPDKDGRYVPAPGISIKSGSRSR